MRNIDYKLKNELDEDINIDLKKIWMTFWNRKEILIKVFCCVFVIFIILGLFSPKKYKVEADLYIDKSNNTNLVDINPYAIEELGAGGGMSQLLSGGGGNLSNELEIMYSPLIFDKVVKDNDIRIKKKWGIIPNKKEGELLPGYIFAKNKALSIENKKGTNVVTIEFTAKNPKFAYDIVSSIIKNSIEVSTEIHSEKAKKDIQILEQEYNKIKSDLNSKMKSSSVLPQTALGGTGNIAAISAFSKSAQQALSSIKGQYKTSAKSEITISEQTAKLTQIATKLQWAKMVEDMSDSSKIMVLKEPQLLRDFEYASPKLSNFIILGILFGAISSLIVLVLLELTDKKLTYSLLSSEIIYNDSDFLDNVSQLFLLNKDKRLSCIIFDNPNDEVIKLFSKYKNLDIIKADISEVLIDSLNSCDNVVLFAKIGKSSAKLYKNIKNIIQNKNRELIKEILV